MSSSPDSTVISSVEASSLKQIPSSSLRISILRLSEVFKSGATSAVSSVTSLASSSALESAAAILASLAAFSAANALAS